MNKVKGSVDKWKSLTTASSPTSPRGAGVSYERGTPALATPLTFAKTARAPTIPDFT